MAPFLFQAIYAPAIGFLFSYYSTAVEPHQYRTRTLETPHSGQVQLGV